MCSKSKFINDKSFSFALTKSINVLVIKNKYRNAIFFGFLIWGSRLHFLHYCIGLLVKQFIIVYNLQTELLAFKPCSNF